MNAGDKFFFDILSALNRKEILQQFILIGGWCQRLYRHLFGNPPEISALRTADIDFLVRNPGRITKKVDIPGIFKTLGFDEVYSMPKGYIKYIHPDLEIEFLVTQIGKGQDKPFPLKKLNTNAQRLRYLDIIEKSTQEIEFYGLKVIVPQPAAFVINKFITSQRRKDPAKKEKDLQTAKEIGEYILGNENQKKLMRDIFNGLNLRLKRKSLEIIKINSEDIYNYINKTS